ncbi:hypothetical protein ACVBEF_01225 [Glaciimonas sp. GG7]
MKNHLPLTDKEGEVRELAAEDFARFKPVAEVLPDALLEKLGVSQKIKRLKTKGQQLR